MDSQNNLRFERTQHTNIELFFFLGGGSDTRTFLLFYISEIRIYVVRFHLVIKITLNSVQVE